MHQNGKEDSLGSSQEPSNDVNPFGSNTFPLISRSSMKRPFSLASEREHQTATIRDHFRCRGFRSRSKTIHSDTFGRPIQYRDMIGPVNAFSAFPSHNSDRSGIKGFLEAHRKKQSNYGNLPLEHLFMSEPILDEEMAEEQNSEDGQIAMFHDNKESQTSSGDAIKHISSFEAMKTICTLDKSFSCSLGNTLDFNSNPTGGPRQNFKSKSNFLYSSDIPPSNNAMIRQACSCGRLSESFTSSKFSITVASKPSHKCGDTCTASTTCHAKSNKAHEPFQCSKVRSPKLTVQNSLSSVALPKSAVSENKVSALHSGTAHIPTEAEKAQFQRSLDSATTLVFHRRSGLPLTSSPVSDSLLPKSAF